MPQSFVIDIPELAMFEEKWGIIPAEFKVALRTTLMRSAIATQGIIREETPVRTGALRQSIDVLAVTDTRAIIGTKKNYAGFVNNGTGLYGPNKSRIVPVSARVLATKTYPGFGKRNGQGYYIIGRSAAGQQANPFFDRAKRRATPVVRAEFQALLKTITGALS